ncbi:hypothetical protein, partial [Rhizobium leguminosarum]|uniref:hypothetical protein n=1 Tax=Rhizobium leguminosarum TaxID=384 RepID=UPI001C90D39F
ILIYMGRSRYFTLLPTASKRTLSWLISSSSNMPAIWPSCMTAEGALWPRCGGMIGCCNCQS